MYYVYVLCSTHTKELYVGYTSDLRRRLKEHLEGRNRSTRRTEGSWRLIYYEAFLEKSDAFKREQRLKEHGRARQELFKRLQASLNGC